MAMIDGKTLGELLHDAGGDRMAVLERVLSAFAVLSAQFERLEKCLEDASTTKTTKRPAPAPAPSARVVKKQKRVTMFYEEMENIHPSTPVYFTDGSCLPKNPGFGGAGWVLTRAGMCRPGTSDKVEAQASLCLGNGVTNNVAELAAIKLAIEHATKGGETKVVIASDSRYSIGVCTNMKANVNLELIQSIKDLIERSRIELQWVHVPAHCKISANELVDGLAKDAANESRLKNK